MGYYPRLRLLPGRPDLELFALAGAMSDGVAKIRIAISDDVTAPSGYTP